MTNESYDKNGNRLFCKNKMVFLALASGKQKAIGTIHGDTFRCYRKTIAHTFNKTAELGFNHRLMSKGNFKYVEVEMDNGERFRIEREKILEYGNIRNFKTQGFELQVFLPMKEFSTQREVA